MDYRLDRMWKDSNNESQASKLLFELYRFKNKPQIYYPPVKTKKKPLPFEENKAKPKEKPVIDYPDLNKPQPPKFHPIDFVPKKKNKQVISNEVQEAYKYPLNYAKKGTNREQLKADLQEKFQFSNGILPKTFNTAGVKELPPKEKQKPQEEISDNPEILFDMILKEIEDRQQHLEDLKAYGQLTADKEHRLKGEIAVRISELQRLKEMAR
ncbi:hypothetical protein SteCoe_24128 [Stentor coeruleus]|uniref:Uncharacterized protein n=1 Tax=Stentor coeruleus TaxID=5963 RepID=A0A1R2BIA3_9CILI|nr:hypothetical protein SteCoe_24128 [Stentor coeruleus]